MVSDTQTDRQTQGYSILNAVGLPFLFLFVMAATINRTEKGNLLAMQDFTNIKYRQLNSKGFNLKMVTRTMAVLLLLTDANNLDMIAGRLERCDGRLGACIATAFPLSTPSFISRR